MKKILVTGGAGYIGSHVCKRLAQAGYLPITFDSLVRGHREAVRFGPLEIGDIRDGARLQEVVAKYRPDGAIHFAGLIAVGESVREPDLYNAVNVAGSRNVFESLRLLTNPCVVFSSSAAVYGNPSTCPIAETATIAPVSPYGAGKAQTEVDLKALDRAKVLRYVALRYFNAAGADSEVELGECHDPETHLIPLALRATEAKPLQLFGTDYPTRDGTCVRDYIHVEDLARAHVLALEWLLAKGFSRTYNLGTSEGYTVKEILNEIRAVTGREVPHVYVARRPGDPAELVADSRLIERELGWKPVHSLRSIMKTAWNWETRYQKLAASVSPSVSP